MVIKRFIAIFGMSLSLIACATSEPIDRSLLNHPSMDLRNNATIPPKSFLTGLDAISNASSANVCSTCLK
ncbi:MAG: hypothetical protein HRU09_21230 [Oligoflexales bacterium]|nr:hypothetical protein [Oligoflexales bacterium]